MVDDTEVAIQFLENYSKTHLKRVFFILKNETNEFKNLTMTLFNVIIYSL